MHNVFTLNRGPPQVNNSMLDIDRIFDEAREFLDEDLSPAQSRRLRRMLRRGVVRFSYRKKSDGSVRKARGTLRKDMLPKYEKPKRARPDPLVFRYWDLDKMSFRSFLRANFIKIDGKDAEKPEKQEKRAEEPGAEEPGAE